MKMPYRSEYLTRVGYESVVISENRVSCSPLVPNQFNKEVVIEVAVYRSVFLQACRNYAPTTFRNTLIGGSHVEIRTPAGATRPFAGFSRRPVAFQSALPKLTEKIAQKYKL